MLTLINKCQYKEKSRSRTTKFCSWESENGHFVARWRNKIIFSIHAVFQLGRKYQSGCQRKLTFTGPLGKWISKCFSCPACTILYYIHMLCKHSMPSIVFYGNQRMQMSPITFQRLQTSKFTIHGLLQTSLLSAAKRGAVG